MTKWQLESPQLYFILLKCLLKPHLFCSSLLNGCIARTSDKVNLTNKFELPPHMTLIKVNRPIARLRKSKYLPSALYENHNFDDFGIQEVDNLQLCVIEDTTRADGFYTTLTHLSFSWKILTAIRSSKAPNFFRLALFSFNDFRIHIF